MPPLAALGTAAITAATTATVAGLATGAAVISAGTGLLAQVTGSKTLGKISMGFGIASGAGFLMNGISSAGKASNVMKATTGEKGLLQTDNIGDILKSPTKATKTAKAEGFNTFKPTGAQTSSMDSFSKGANSIDEYKPAQTSFDPELEKSFFERANNTLTQYNPLINLAAGVGQGYMQSQQMDLQKELLDKRLNIDQQLIDRTNVNNGTPTNFNPALNLQRTANPFPLLQRN